MRGPGPGGEGKRVSEENVKQSGHCQWVRCLCLQVFAVSIPSRDYTDAGPMAAAVKAAEKKRKPTGIRDQGPKDPRKGSVTYLSSTDPQIFGEYLMQPREESRKLIWWVTVNKNRVRDGCGYIY